MLIWLIACNTDDVVVHNDPPELSIVSPVDLDSFTEGFGVPFEVIVNDDQTPLEELTTLWVSDLDGELEGETQLSDRLVFETNTLSRGEHIVTLLATDTSGGMGEASVVLTIRDNTEPLLEFTEPTENHAWPEGDEVVATVRLTDDTEPDLTAISLTWELDGLPLDEAPAQPGIDGTATLVLEGVPTGEHTLTAFATDTPGALVEATVAFALLVPDVDGDGYENDRLGGGDCNDDDATINPDVPEVCDDNDTDEDCSGAADDDDPNVTDAEALFIDGDGDGYGAATVLTCDPDSAVALDGDCDDTRIDVNPSEYEICDDGLDNNCDGSASGCRHEGDLDLYAADVLVYGTSENANLGYSVSVGDLDGDGLDDLAMGARRLDGADSDSGALVVVHGGHFGELYADADGVTLEGTEYQGYAGTQVTTLGDMNGDGLAEVLVGAPQNNPYGNNSGQAWLLYGPLTLGGSLDSADAIFDGEATNDNAGSAVGAAGDIDGDGIPDLLIGAREESSAHNEGGAGYLFLGPVSGDWSLGDADGKFRAEAASDRLGTAITGVGDTNGDGYDDMMLGAPDEDSGGTGAGAAYLVLGDTTSVWSALSLRMSAADAKLLGSGDGMGAGDALHGPGDLDGDGYHEVLVGSSSANGDAGGIHLLRGPIVGTLNLTSSSETNWEGATANQKFGFAITTGDFDADGATDLLTGLPERDTGGTDSGSTALFYGPWPTGDVEGDFTADAWIDGNTTNQYTGFSVAAGDLNGDGKDDLVIGSPNEDTDASNGGIVSVLFGRGL